VSACHSERIGKIFKAAGVPIVIACNQGTKVSDDAATFFGA
jgi:hypothetical protein